MRVFRLLSLRRLRRQPMRVGVAVLAVAAGVSLAIAVLTVTSSVETSVRDFGRTLAGPAPLRVVGAIGRGGLPEEAVATIEGTPGVAGVVPMIQAVTLADRADGRGDPTNVLAFGVDCRVEALIGELGCTPELLAAAGSQPIIAGAQLIEELGPGASLRTDSGRVPLDGVLTSPELAQLNGGRVVVFALAGAQALFARPGQVDVAYVQPSPGTEVAALQTELEDVLGEHLGVLERDDPPPGIESFLANVLPLFSLLGIFALGTGAALVYNTVSLSLEERRRVLAVVGALGSRRRTLVGGTVAETALLGALGGVLGAAGGVLIAGPILNSFSRFAEAYSGIVLERHVAPGLFVTGLLLGGVVGAGSALWPALRASRLDVAAELSGRARVAEARPARLGRRLAIWSAFTAVGLVGCWAGQRNGGIEKWQAAVGPLGFLVVSLGTLMAGTALGPLLVRRLAPLFRRRRSAPARLAVANLVREPRRTGVMAAAVTAAIVTAFATDGFVESARTSIVENFERDGDGVAASTIGPNEGASAFLGSDALEALRAVPGVADVRRGTFVLTGHGSGDIIGVGAYEGELVNQNLIVGTNDPERFEAGEVLVGPAIARNEGVRPGDTVRLMTPTGAVEVPVQGVWANGDFGGRNVTMPYSLMEQLYGPQPPAFVNVVPEEGISFDELAETLRAVAPSIDPELEVRTPTELATEIGDVIDEQMAPFRVMQQGLLFVAFVAVLSTLLLVGVQRQRELGLLAAVGSGPKTLWRMVVGEAGIVGVAGLVQGAIIGPLVLWGLLQVIPVLIGFHDPFAPDWASLVRSGGVAIVVVLLASLWPAWRASRVEVLQALRYE